MASPRFVPVPLSMLGRIPVWDPFGKRRVFIKEVMVMEGRNPKESQERTMLYTTSDRLMFYAKDDGDWEDDLRHPGVQVNPADLLPKHRSGWMRAEAIHDDDHYKQLLFAEWFPGCTHLQEHFVNEINVYQLLRAHPHPNICEYRGCEVENGLVASIVLKRYPTTLEFAEQDGVKLDVARILEGLRSALDHLASLGLAHNDVNPGNIAVDEHGSPILIDFECCLPYGRALSWKSGTRGFARTKQWDPSAKENDDFGYDAVARWLDAVEGEAKGKRDA